MAGPAACHTSREYYGVRRRGSAVPGDAALCSTGSRGCALFRLAVDNAADIGGICGLVAGIPLAIELVAAQVRALSTGQVKARLDHSFQMRAGANRLAP